MAYNNVEDDIVLTPVARRIIRNEKTSRIIFGAYKVDSDDLISDDEG